jgi:alkylation response protein AidB-like acyl-CoA dehydrogenase
MNVELTEEQKLLRDSVAKFCKAELPSEKIREMAETEPAGISEEAWRKIAEQGWIGTMLPEQYGGLGLGVTELAIIVEEMGRALVPGPFLSCAALGGPALAIGGSDEAKSRWLEKIISGETKITVALLDEGGQLGAEFVSTKAKEKDAGEYRLSGTKFFVPDLAAADLVIVAARTSKKGRDGTSLFLIEKNAKGVGVQENKLTDMTSSSGQLTLNKVKVGADAIIGEVNHGWRVVEQVLQFANVCIAGAAVAGAEKVLQTTVAYAKERHQFGVPIGSFQAIKHPLANVFAEIESARSAYHYAAWAVDAASPDAKAAVATARLAATEAYRRTTLDCLQAHGGIGFTWEYDLHLYLKRAKHYQYFLGVDSDYEEVVAREALRI